MNVKKEDVSIRLFIPWNVLWYCCYIAILAGNDTKLGSPPHTAVKYIQVQFFTL